MRYEVITPSGDRIELGIPLKVRLSMEEDAPAHGFSGVFPLKAPFPELRFLSVYDDQDALLFGGIVDSLQEQITSGGAVMKLEGRSKAALLLDNEAQPQTYVNPSLGQLFAHHGAPYGLQKAVGKSSQFYWTYVIRKGISEWQVFWEFCLYCLGVEPKVTPEGILDATGKKPEGVLYFSNDGGIPYTALRHQRFPCKQLSQLWMQDALGEGYNTNLLDLWAIRSGIQRTRYVTAANWQGRRKLKKARRQSDALVLECPGFVSAPLGMAGAVTDGMLGTVSNYSVAGWVYTLDKQGERTTITLKTDL